MKRYKTVDDYIAGNPEWEKELTELRALMNSTEMEETVKWGGPCYTVNGKNVAGLAAFKNHLAVWFHQGVFLSDPKKRLINAQEGTTKGLRQWRYSKGDKLEKRLLKQYVLEAIQNEKNGKKISPAKKKTVIPPELKKALGSNKKAKSKFDAMAPGKQREYCEHIASAKQEATKQRRLEKVMPMIEKGIGLNDKYR